MATKKRARTKATAPELGVVAVSAPETTAVRRIKSWTSSSGAPVEQGGGISQQIPTEVLQKMAHQIITPPLGERSFEDFAALLLENTDYAASVNQIATDAAGLGWHLDPVDTETPMDDAEIEVATKFFQAPNPNATLGDIVKCTIVDFLSLANAWIEVLRTNNDPNGLPSGLVHAPGIAMRLRSNLKGFVMLGKQESAHAFFRTLFSGPDEPESIEERSGRVLNEMIYFRNYHPASPWYGVPRIVPAIKAIKGNTYSNDRNIRYFTNRAFPEYLGTIEGETDNIDKKELDALAEDIIEHFTNLIKGDDYKFFLASLPKGVTLKLERLAAPFDDTTLRQYRIDNRDEIVRSQGMMPNRIGIIESGNLGGGTGESQIEIYKTSTVKPLQEMIERVFNAILHTDTPLGFGLTTVSFKFDEIDSTDEAREASIAGMLSGTGWLTFNDGRAYVSQFLKTHLDAIEEPWADLPLQLVVPQLAAFFDPLESDLQSEPGLTPGLSQFGTAGLQPQVRAVIAPTIAIDKAYRRFQERQRNGPDKVVAPVAANGS